MGLPPKYDEWLRYIFDRDASLADDSWDVDPPFEANRGELARLASVTFRRCGSDLARFSDDQVGVGLNYILNAARSNVSVEIIAAPIEERVEAVRALGNLYSACFEPRCVPALGHLGEPGSNTPLGFVCYMLWDVSPLAYPGEGRDAAVAGEAILKVLEGALESTNIACVESALHGLGHLHGEDLRPRVRHIIARAMPRIQDERLRQYARAAASGCVL